MAANKKSGAAAGVPQKGSVSDNIARYLKEHEQSAANKRNMHIHEPDGPVPDQD